MKYVSEIFKINVKLCPRSHLLSPVQRIILAASAPVWHHSDVDLNILSYPAPPLLYCSWLSLPPMNFIDIRFISLQSKSNIFGKDRSQDRSCDVQTLCLQCSISYRGKKSFLCKSRDFGGNVFLSGNCTLSSRTFYFEPPCTHTDNHNQYKYSLSSSTQNAPMFLVFRRLLKCELFHRYCGSHLC